MIIKYIIIDYIIIDGPTYGPTYGTNVWDSKTIKKGRNDRW